MPCHKKITNTVNTRRERERERFGRELPSEGLERIVSEEIAVGQWRHWRLWPWFTVGESARDISLRSL
jgi:hypothetical protein